MGQQWICGELLHLGRQREQAIQDRELRHADDDFHHDDPFALLLGILSHQYRTQAGNAWEVPQRLKQALGHLDPVRIATEDDQVRNAFATRKIARNGTEMAKIRRRIDPFYGRAAKNSLDGGQLAAPRLPRADPTRRGDRRRRQRPTGVPRRSTGAL